LLLNYQTGAREITVSQLFQRFFCSPFKRKESLSMTQHYAAIHHFRYKEQPSGQQMGFITNRFKFQPLEKNAYMHKVTLMSFEMNQILAACSNGQCIVPANYEVRDNKMSFVSASLIFIDVDDDFKITVPEQLVQQIPNCTGYFYTFSHGKKGNRYRLIFQLDQPIIKEENYKIIVEIIAKEINELIQYPEWYFEPYTDEKSGKTVTRKPILDTNARNPLTPIRTGIYAPFIVNYDAKLNTQHYVTLAREELNRRAEAKKENYEMSLNSYITFDELKEMTELIGHIPSGSGQGDVWNRLVYGLKHYANSGGITQEQGEELFYIISGNEQGANAWSRLNPSGSAKIGSLIDEAKRRGYKRNPYRFGLKQTVNAEVYPVEHVKVSQHIPTELAKEWLLRKQKLLIESPTGSGKSTALIKASLELANECSPSFYIFSAPTRPLAKQLATKHNVMLVRGTMNNLNKQVFEAQKKGVRVFVATYDMTNTLMDWLKGMNEHATFSLMIDEFHKTVTDYSQSFRMNTISELLKAMDRSVSVVALSGTPEDILKSSFNAIIRVNNGTPASPCEDFAVYTYKQQKDALPMLIKLIDSWTKKRKLLIYLNNKDVISQLYDILRKRGIVTRTVKADEKQNKTYKQMIEKEMIDEDVQVILATSVIADGISINNEFEWECIVVANHFSKLFNTSLLKQMSNRFRKKYRRFSVFMQAPTASEEKSFYIDSAYTYLLAAANRFAKEINEEFSTADFALYRASILEQRYGLLEENNRIVTDPHYLRYKASVAKEKYYMSRRNAFVKALENILHKKAAGILSLESELYKEEHQQELVKIEAKLHEQYQAHKEKRAHNLNNFSKVFTKNVYEAFVEDRHEVLETIKDEIIVEQFNCIKQLHKYTSFEVCTKVAAQVTRKHETYKFVKRLSALTDTIYFNSIHRNTPTKRIVNALNTLEGFFTREELLTHYEVIAKKHRIKTEDVQAIANQFFTFEQERDNKTRYYQLKSLTIEDLAAEFELTVPEVAESFKMHLNYQKSVVKAALSSYVQTLETTQLKLALV